MVTKDLTLSVEKPERFNKLLQSRRNISLAILALVVSLVLDKMLNVKTVKKSQHAFISPLNLYLSIDFEFEAILSFECCFDYY